MMRVAVVTGTRAEWGLLRPVCEAIRRERGLALQVVAGGAHLLAPARTVEEVRAFAPGLVEFAMQVPGDTGRLADARALGRGTAALADIYSGITPDIVLVLGDRIEAFAAASAAAIGGIRVGHIHGGDRAEGVADESMRHAITKLAHLHFTASAESTQRVLSLGERPEAVHLVGSPSIDGLDAIAPLDDRRFIELGAPEYVFLMHPCGRSDDTEHGDASAALDALAARGRVLALMPNSDPGRAGITRAIAERCGRIRVAEHLPRAEFVGLLRRPEIRALVGNSSAGIIEASALGVRVVDVGNRQRGRERGANVVHCARAQDGGVAAALAEAERTVVTADHPYGDGSAGARIARILADLDPSRVPLAKLNSF